MEAMSGSSSSSSSAENGIPKKPQTNNFAFACATLASTAFVLLGFDMGVMSGATLYLKKDWTITNVQVEVIMGTVHLYCLFGTAVAGTISDWIGRRYSITFAGAMFSVGTLLMAFSTNYAILMVGGFIAGVGAGSAFVTALVYTAEVSPASSRGFLASFPEIFLNVGILLGYISNLAFSKLPLHLTWRFMLGVGALPSSLLAVGVLAMPESPRWLVMQGRLGEAKAVLTRTTTEDVMLRLNEIKEAAGISPDRNNAGDGVWRELLMNPTRSVKRVLIAGVGLNFFLKSTGIDVVVFYSPTIFENAGISSDTNKLLATLGVGLFKTVFVLVATFKLDKYGRRPLLLTSVGCMFLPLLTLAISLTVIDHHKVTWAIALCIVMTCAYVAAFSIGLGPITMVYTSEIFPLRLRAQGVSLCVVVNRTVSVIISITFLSFSKTITTGGVFFMFSGITLVAWVFFFMFLPETRGHTLEEMDELFDDFRWKNSTLKNNKDGKEGTIVNANGTTVKGGLLNGKNAVGV